MSHYFFFNHFQLTFYSYFPSEHIKTYYSVVFISSDTFCLLKHYQYLCNIFLKILIYWNCRRTGTDCCCSLKHIFLKINHGGLQTYKRQFKVQFFKVCEQKRNAADESLKAGLRSAIKRSSEIKLGFKRAALFL